MIRSIVARLHEPARGRARFIRGLPHGARVLDVGCGNDSPRWFKRLRPDLHYVGIDVGDYNQRQDPALHADRYVVVPPDRFAAEIESFEGGFDAVVSSHNLEHCDEPERVLRAMIGALRPQGLLFVATPCEQSVGFPRRAGCLNFFDDATHQRPVSWSAMLDAIAESEATVEFAAPRYRPLGLLLRGALLEPYSALTRRVMPDGSTWALYGFESVVWARRVDDHADGG